MSTLRPGYTLRQARGDDFEAVSALLHELGRDPIEEDEADDCRAVFRQQVIDPDRHHMVVVDDEERAIAGFCSLSFRSRLNHATEEAWIADLCVTGRARDDGAELALLEEAERVAIERGCWQLAHESGHQHAEAHELLRRFHMRDAGRYFRKRLGA